MKRKIKVLFVITRATQSGPIRVIENIIKYIDCNKYELYLISIEPELPERSILSTFKNEFREYQYIPVSKQNGYGKYSFSSSVLSYFRLLAGLGISTYAISER